MLSPLTHVVIIGAPFMVLGLLIAYGGISASNMECIKKKGISLDRAIINRLRNKVTKGEIT